MKGTSSFYVGPSTKLEMDEKRTILMPINFKIDLCNVKFVVNFLQFLFLRKYKNPLVA
jgi:hypothetical protein